ncbi:MAG: hypothetical protein VKI82_00235 [Leptolyngbya sp.]|nr:hypothetical protein [Leptolyngbya sp.]
MGLIKSIFGIIGGVFQAILSVFGLGKKSEFFMELDESAAPAAAPAAPEPAKTVTEPVTAPATAPVAASPAPAVAPAPKPAPAAAPTTSAPSFAATYLTGPTMPRRRRPGPSLSPFRDMAKQVQAR